MPALFPSAGSSRLLSIAGCLLLLNPGAAAAGQAAKKTGAALSPYKRAQRLREALEGRSEQERTRRDYERVMDAYRAVYHGAPGSSRADASIFAVADLLAEQGRQFRDEKSLHDAIAQYEFLRKQYPGSRYRFSALLTMGEIYFRNLDDTADARTCFQQFLKQYPGNPLANDARLELDRLQHGTRGTPGLEGLAADRSGKKAAPESMLPQGAAIATSVRPHKRHQTVLDAAIASQGGDAAQSPPPVSSATGKPPASAVARESTANAAAGGASIGKSSSGFEEIDLPPARYPAADSHPGSGPQALSGAIPSAMPPLHGKLPLVTGIRYWSTPVYTRVAIDLQSEVQYEAVRVPHPDRIFFDLHGTRLAPDLVGKSDEVIDDGFLKRVRAAQFSNNITRIVLDVNDVSEYSCFFLPNPSRLIIDVHGRKERSAPVNFVTAGSPGSPPAKSKAAKMQQESAASSGPTIGIGSALVSVDDSASEPRPDTHSQEAEVRREAASSKMAGDPVKTNAEHSAIADVATLGNQPNQVKATKHPTTAPVAQSVAGTEPAPQPDDLVAAAAAPPASTALPAKARSRHTPSYNPAVPPVNLTAPEIHEAQPTADGQRSLVRALGLKINRIVVDAGHGGHDSGTIGPGGIEEKDVVLDVALRLGTLLKQRLGADVIYTRADDTFIPLETRTAIANKAQADLFISVHANSSSDASARGVETYYLNFTSSADALEVAARENAVSDQSIHQLSDLVKKIALQDKINESREFASDVEQSLYTGLEDGNPGLKDRGVKKAPFVVLIGANMPSILAEISFLTNPSDAEELRGPRYRERIAESLYLGVARYVGSLSGVRVADASPSGAR
jgi:N-acetylmuramoyl-L-alanine amidase